MDISSLVLSKGSRFMRACNFHTGIAHAGRRRKLENIDAQTTEGYRWTSELTLLVLVNSLKARHATACNASRHLRLIKRQTGRCAAASPLLNVSHLSPSFSTFETRQGETGRGVKRRSEAGEVPACTYTLACHLVEDQIQQPEENVLWLHSRPFFRLPGHPVRTARHPRKFSRRDVDAVSSVLREIAGQLHALSCYTILLRVSLLSRELSVP